MCELLKLLEKENNDVEVAKLATSCRYHKKALERFRQGNIFKGFKCLELFHTVYPKVLALMYDAQFQEEELILRCPGYENTVTVCLYRLPVRSFTIRFFNKIKQLIYPLWPRDILKYIVYVEVLSVQGYCFAGCKKRDRFEIYHSGTVCPQALYAVFPAVLLSPEDEICRCPSHINKVIFQKLKND